MNKKGLAQIPLMIGLLIMAVAVPIATKLVQENQENRGRATEIVCNNSSVTAFACRGQLAGSSCLGGFDGTCKVTTADNCACVSNTTPTPITYTCSGTCKSTGCPCGKASGTCQGEDECCITNCPTPTSIIPSPQPCIEEGVSFFTGSCCGDLQKDCTTISGSFGYCYCRKTGFCVSSEGRPTLDNGETFCEDIPLIGSKKYTCTNGDISVRTYIVSDNCDGSFEPSPTSTPTQRPTMTPTMTPTPTPTGASGTCTNVSGQWCTAGLCRDKGGTVGVGECDGDQYCCQPNPSTCVKTNGDCSMEDCCARNQCIEQGGFSTCYRDDQIPTLFPTITPAFVKCCPKYNTASSINTCKDASQRACEINETYCILHTSDTCPPPEDEPPIVQPTDEPISTPIPGGLCTQCQDPLAKSKGDADCSGVININDSSIWRSEFIDGELGIVTRNNWQADFDCDGKVTINDVSIWRDNFIKSL